MLSFPDELTRHSFLLGERARAAESTPRPPTRTPTPRQRPQTHFPSCVFLMMNSTTLLMSMKRMRRPMSPPTTPTMMRVTVLSVSTTAGQKGLRGRAHPTPKPHHPLHARPPGVSPELGTEEVTP